MAATTPSGGSPRWDSRPFRPNRSAERRGKIRVLIICTLVALVVSSWMKTTSHCCIQSDLPEISLLSSNFLKTSKFLKSRPVRSRVMFLRRLRGGEGTSTEGELNTKQSCNYTSQLKNLSTLSLDSETPPTAWLWASKCKNWMDAEKGTVVELNSVVNLMVRRGFCYASCESYGGISGFFDYGPLGTEMRRKIRHLWWQRFVQESEEVIGIETSIIGPEKLYRASGHLEHFVDPMVVTPNGERFRADQVVFLEVYNLDGDSIGYVSALDSDNVEEELRNLALKFVKKQKQDPNPSLLSPNKLDFRYLTNATNEERVLIPRPGELKPAKFSQIRNFNLMFSTNIGSTSEGATGYLRPETAQGIFANFHRYKERMTIPFGVAQIGRAFRNEISPRNFIFRAREFEQMEIEFFISPDTWPKYHNYWVEAFWEWFLHLGIREDMLAKDVHESKDLAHYAKACTDITFKYPFGTQELMGIAARGDYDLIRHEELTGKDMKASQRSQMTNKIRPHVIEPSVGLDRLFLALLVSAYHEETIAGEPRKVLRLSPSVAPITVGVFPLMVKNQRIRDIARNIRRDLSR
ncbi:hypothetical protein AAMO2058_001136000 [Amorphochlora amoebiformis]